MRMFKFLAVLMSGLLVASTAVAEDDAVADLAKALKSPDIQAQITACHKLSQLGPSARETVPRLIDVLKATDDAELQRCAVLTLAAIGEGAQAAVPVLVDVLGSNNAKIRAYAAYALGQIGPGARDAATKLLGLITDKDPAVRSAARDALRKIDAPEGGHLAADGEDS